MTPRAQQSVTSAPQASATFRGFLHQSWGEYLLVVLSSFCLAEVARNAFFLESATLHTPTTLAGCAVLCFVLYGASFRRRQAAPWIAVFLVLCAAIVAACLALSAGANGAADAPALYDDAEGNFLYLGLCIIFCATAGFLLTRTLAGSVVWFLTTALTCSVVEAFYQCGALAPSLGAVLLALSLIVHRNFRGNLLRAQAAKAHSAGSSLVASLLPAAAAVAVAACVWFALIAPLSPGTLHVYLITDYRHLPVVELRGVADQEPQLNLDMTSDQLQEGARYTTDNLLEGESDTLVDAREYFDQLLTGGSRTSQGEDASGNEAGQNGSLDSESLDQEYNAFAYSVAFPWIVALLALVALVIAAAILVAVMRRKRRLGRLEAMLGLETPNDQAAAIYRFLLERLDRVGISVPAGMLLGEFAENARDRLAPFNAQARVDFTQITASYEQSVYGQRVLTEDDLVPFVSYYLGFWKAARLFLGPLKYFVISWRL